MDKKFDQEENQKKSHQINVEETKNIQQYWDNFADAYENTFQLSMVQGTITCAIMTEMLQKGNRVIEVGCGSGIHSLILASSFLQQKGVLVSCDLSFKMISKLYQNFHQKQNDYRMAPGNKLYVESSVDYTQIAQGLNNQLQNLCDIENIIQNQGEFNKLLYGCQANNEILPFPDSYFDVYIANLSLQIVSNHMNQINEAYRVLKSGSRAAFTIWGKRQNCQMFTLFDVIVQKYLGPEQQGKNISKSNFDLYEKGTLQKDFESVGFKAVKMWLQTSNLMFVDGNEFMQKMGDNRLRSILKIHNISDKFDQIRQDLIENYDMISGKSTCDLKTFQICVIVAFKD